MSWQRLQASLNEGGCRLQIAVLARKLSLDEGEFRPSERRMRDEPIKEFFLV